jgi:hypothetical protein
MHMSHQDDEPSPPDTKNAGLRKVAEVYMEMKIVARGNCRDERVPRIN